MLVETSVSHQSTSIALSLSLSLCPPLFRMCVLYYAFRLFAHAIHKNITHKFCVQFHLNEEVLKKKMMKKIELLYSSVFLFVPSSSLMSNFSIHCCCYYLFVCFLYKREKKSSCNSRELHIASNQEWIFACHSRVARRLLMQFNLSTEIQRNTYTNSYSYAYEHVFINWEAKNISDK